MRRSAEFVFLLLVGCLAISPDLIAQDVPETSQTQTVRGVVVNSVTHEPIGRALVSTPDNSVATMTDGQGRFELTLPKVEGVVNPGVSAGFTSFSGIRRTFVAPTWPGMLSARKPGFLVDPDASPLNLPGKADQEITISLVPEALIVGRIHLANSDGFTPIQLQLYKRDVQEGRAHWAAVADTTCRTNGEFRFAGLPAGTYKLFTLEFLDQDPETFRPGAPNYAYPPAYFPGAGSFAAAATIHLTPGKIFEADLSPIRQRYYPVKIPVGNAGPGVPLNVNVMVQGHKGPGFSLGYNDRNRTIEGMLPNGTYTVQAAGFATPATNGVVSITIRDAPAEGPPMMLIANASISVNVRWEVRSSEIRNQLRGSMQGGISVRLEPTSDFGQERPIYLRPPNGPRDSSLVFEGVPPGRYWVRVDTGAGYPSAMSSGGIDLLRQPLTVGAGAAAPIEITMRDEAAEIDGTVEGWGALPGNSQGANDIKPEGTDAVPYQSFTYVYCIPLPDGPGQFAQTSVGRNGEFHFARLAPGAYRLLVFPRQQAELEYENDEAMRAYESKGLVIRVVAGQKEHVRLPMILPGE